MPAEYIRYKNAIYRLAARSEGDWAWLGDDTQIFVPDVRITEDDPGYVYHPTRGSSATVAVEDIDGKIVGWMSVDDLPGGPYKNVREWMVKYKVPGWEEARDYRPPEPSYESTHYKRPRRYPTRNIY